MRRYDDPIQVWQPSGDEGDGHGSPESAPPESFRWRGRRYRVCTVIGHWHERTPWWRHALEPSATPGELLLQEEVWRVEALLAHAPRDRQPGVFDLINGCRWRLIRIAD
jgi:hypothetical protein